MAGRCVVNDDAASEIGKKMTDDNFQNLALNESFERVAKVAEERAAFNEQMAIRAALDARGLEIRDKNK